MSQSPPLAVPTRQVDPDDDEINGICSRIVAEAGLTRWARNPREGGDPVLLPLFDQWELSELRE